MASTSESFGYNLLELLAADLPVITSDVGAAREFERRGVVYLGRFTSAAELSAIFADLPQRFARYRNAAPANRSRLEEIYRANDRAYIDYVRQNVAPDITDLDVRKRAVEGRGPVKSVDVVCCTYNRFDELTLSLPSILREVEQVAADGFACRVIVVYQNDDLPARLYAWRPDWRDNSMLVLVRSDPPGLTRARNVGLAAGDGDLVLFVDDDVVLEPGFIAGHVAAVNAHPRAIGSAGRIRGPSDNYGSSQNRAVGQVRPSGFVEPNFNSVESRATLVCHTPMGANMAYRRGPMTAIYGQAWFDERMPPPAFRDETLLGTELFRRGEHLVFASNAVLTHFESVLGGCGFRSKRSIRKLADHFSMDYLFLNRLYEPWGLARALAPLLLLRRELELASSRTNALKRIIVNVRGYFLGRAMFSAPRPENPEKAAPHAIRMSGHLTKTGRP
jgi:glycosyltransferase involved in cell wall biosynthesis